MARLVKDLGVDVPVIMCEGGTRGSIDTVNGFSIPDRRAAGKIAYHYLDGHLVAQSLPPFAENRGPTVSVGHGGNADPGEAGAAANDLELLVRDGFRQRFAFTSAPCVRRLDILAAVLGLVKGDWQIAGSMQTERKGIWGEVRHDGRALSGWEMRPRLVGEGQLAGISRAAAGSPRPCV